MMSGAKSGILALLRPMHISLLAIARFRDH